MKSESTIIEYDELCILYDGMMNSLNNLHCSHYEGVEQEIIKSHHLAAKMMTLMLQTKAKEHMEDPN